MPCVSSNTFFSRPSIALLLGVLAAASVACAPSKPAETAPAPAAEQAAAPTKANEPAQEEVATNEPPTPAGQLVCQANNAGNKEQLYLESWDGDSAQGTLRTFTPSGKVRYEPVHAERYKARIVIDDPGNTDLAVHKATIVDNGKGKHIQLGDYNAPWSKCN
jgi:hypothetical protein